MRTEHRLAWLALTAAIGPGMAARAENQDDLINAGKEAVKAIASLPPGRTSVTYFDVMLGPDKVIGYVEASLTGVGGEKPGYEYVARTVIHFPTNARLHVDVSAKLLPDFQPVEIEVKRTTIDANGEVKPTVQRAVLTADKVTLSGEAGEQKASRDVPRAPGTFIYGIETLVQRLDFTKHQSFRLDEFDMVEGGGRPLKFVAKTWDDGTPTVLTYNSDDSLSYQFWFDAAGNLIRWGEASLPALFVRTSKESVEKWKARTLGPKPGVSEKPVPSPGG